jgi:hypothetical protein
VKIQKQKRGERKKPTAVHLKDFWVFKNKIQYIHLFREIHPKFQALPAPALALFCGFWRREAVFVWRHSSRPIWIGCVDRNLLEAVAVRAVIHGEPAPVEGFQHPKVPSPALAILTNPQLDGRGGGGR